MTLSEALKWRFGHSSQQDSYDPEIASESHQARNSLAKVSRVYHSMGRRHWKNRPVMTQKTPIMWSLSTMIFITRWYLNLNLYSYYKSEAVLRDGVISFSSLYSSPVHIVLCNIL